MFRILWAFIASLMMNSLALAEWNWTPRLENFQSETMNNQRLLIKNTLNVDLNWVRLYAESFAEQNVNSTFAEELRSPPKGYLLEAYMEFHWGDFFVKVGRQAVRWSEMWATPSLDIFTGHRFNRAFLDPLSEQITHSTGLLVSYAGRTLVLMLIRSGRALRPFTQSLFLRKSRLYAAPSRVVFGGNMILKAINSQRSLQA